MGIATPPVGVEHQSKSAGKTPTAMVGAADSAALAADLAIVVGAWQLLDPQNRAAIVGMARKTTERPNGKQTD